MHTDACDGVCRVCPLVASSAAAAAAVAVAWCQTETLAAMPGTTGGASVAHTHAAACPLVILTQDIV